MRAAPVIVHGQPSWTLVGDDGVPVISAEQFLHWLRAVGRSPNTVRSYARHLTLFYRWLAARESLGTASFSANSVILSASCRWDCRRFRPLAAADLGLR